MKTTLLVLTIWTTLITAAQAQICSRSYTAQERALIAESEQKYRECENLRSQASLPNRSQSSQSPTTERNNPRQERAQEEWRACLDEYHQLRENIDNIIRSNLPC